MHKWVTNIDQKLKKLPICISVALLLIGAAPSVFAASPEELISRYDRISSSEVSATASHDIGFVITNLTVPVGSISIEFCSNSPLIAVACIAPSGFNADMANLNSQQGEAGFIIDPVATNANTILLTRPAALPTGAPARYIFSNITNPNANGSFYARLQTFTSTDGSGLPIQYGGLVFAITSPLSVTTEVPPYLTFCVGVVITNNDCSSINSYFIDVGELSTTAARIATSQFLIATNAANGYSISSSGATLTSGSNTIPAIAPAVGSAPGTSQFGINLRDNSTPDVGSEPIGSASGAATADYGIVNKFKYANGDTLATANTTSDFKKFTVSYITNISSTQAPGVYTTTLTYIALANF